MKTTKLTSLLTVVGGLSLATGACSGACQAKTCAPAAEATAGAEGCNAVGCDATPCAAAGCDAKPCAAAGCSAKPCAAAGCGAKPCAAAGCGAKAE